MSEPTNFKDNAQAWVSIWIDQEGGLNFEGNSASTTQLLGMVKLAEQMIIQQALTPKAEHGESPTEP
jgi:hypothetical protein